MKLTSCVKFFLFSLVGVITLVFICWGWNTSLQDIWINYSSKPEPWVGIFTACVLGVTAYASYKAGESAKIAGEMLELSRQNGRKDDFIKQFTLLIEQHNKSHEIMMEILDSYKIGDNKNVNWNMTIKEASDKLYLNHQFSPYMRMLFRVLKYCDENFYIPGDNDEITKEKKKYTSIVRSMIRNDVLYFVAINSMNENDIFNEYRNKLEKFNFFEHLIIDNISELIEFNIYNYNVEYIEGRVSAHSKKYNLKNYINVIIYKRLLHLFNNEIKNKSFYFDIEEVCFIDNRYCYDIPYTFNYKIASEYTPNKLCDFKKTLESIINYEKIFNSSLKRINEELKSKPRDYDIKYYLYFYLNGEENMKPLKVEGFYYNLKELYELFVKEKIIKKADLLSFVNSQYGLDLTPSMHCAFSHSDVFNINSTSKFEDVFYSCSLYIKNKIFEHFSERKELMFDRVTDSIIKILNKTTLVNNSEEVFKFIRKGNNIVFENKNS